MSNIIELDAHRPHLMIIGPNNEPHIVPRSCLVKMAKGEIELIQKGQEREDIDMIQGIIGDWLERII